jgi:hypothetical protein
MGKSSRHSGIAGSKCQSAKLNLNHPAYRTQQALFFFSLCLRNHANLLRRQASRELHTGPKVVIALAPSALVKRKGSPLPRVLT